MRYFIVLILIIGGSQVMHGQVKFGLLTSIAPSHIDPGELVVDNINDSIRYSITDTRPTWSLGAFLHLEAGDIFVKGSFIGGFGYLDYDKTDWRNSENNLTNKREGKYQIEVPLEIGVNYKRMLFSGGIMYSNILQPEVATIFSSETLNRVFDNDNIGYKFAIGINFETALALELSYVYFDNHSGTAAIDGTIDYDFIYNRNHLTVNFFWNFVRKGWD